jgi:hypothetical protein
MGSGDTMATMDAAQHIIAEIEAYCSREGIAESTFGYRAANDGKFVGRLRNGRRVTTATLERVRDYIATHGRAPAEVDGAGVPGGPPPPEVDPAAAGAPRVNGPAAFRFYDNRQKYLMFVHTCSEKWVVAERVGMELAHVPVTPPALRLFDAGMGDGTVLMRTLREMHRRFPTVPFFVVGKEISLEDVRLCLEKMPDRFNEHPATVFVVTNLYYSEAPSLMPRNLAVAASLNWQEVPLAGHTAHEFENQINGLNDLLVRGWKVRPSEKTGNPLYERPSVLILYRADHRVLLDQIIPRPGQARGQYDLIIASQPFRARMPIEFKVDRVLSPLAESLAPGGRMLTVFSRGRDPGLEIIRKIWPDENPFLHDRHQLLHGLKERLGHHRRDLTFNAYADRRSIFRFRMHTLPSEISENIGTSTLLAAWNAAIYVAQIEDSRLEAVMADSRYLQATRDVLHKYGSLWFEDESFVVTRRRT